MALEGPSPLSGPENVRLPLTPPVAERNAAPTGSGDDSAFIPTADFAQLLRNIRQTTEIRQEVIGEMARRLAAGELFTRSAAEQTVGSMLESKALTDD